MNRSWKLLGALGAAAIMLSACDTLMEISAMYEPTGTYGAPTPANNTYVPDYRTIGTPYDTGPRQTPAGQTSTGGAASSTGSSSGSCASGRPSTCRFPDGSWGSCCAPAQ